MEERVAENEGVSELIGILISKSPDVHSHNFVSDRWPSLLSSMGEK